MCVHNIVICRPPALYVSVYACAHNAKIVTVDLVLNSKCSTLLTVVRERLGQQPVIKVGEAVHILYLHESN